MKTKLITAAAKAVPKIIRYIEKDLKAQYGLSAEASAEFHGSGIGIGTCTVGVLTIESEPGGSTVKLIAQPFAPESGLWNGPNIIPDDLDDGSMEMSLWHDLIWVYAKEIAAKLGMTEQDVMQWGNGILVAAWDGYSKNHGKNRKMVAKLAFHVCEVGRRFWRLLFAIAFAITISGCDGCVQPPDWKLGHTTEIIVIEGGQDGSSR